MQELPTPSGMSTFRAELIDRQHQQRGKQPGRGKLQRRQGARHHDRSERDHGVYVNPAGDRTMRHGTPPLTVQEVETYGSTLRRGQNRPGRRDVTVKRSPRGLRRVVDSHSPRGRGSISGADQGVAPHDVAAPHDVVIAGPDDVVAPDDVAAPHDVFVAAPHDVVAAAPDDVLGHAGWLTRHHGAEADRVAPDDALRPRHRLAVDHRRGIQRAGQPP